MMRRLYITLVCTQALHSAEEIAFGFYRRAPELGARIQAILPSFPLVSLSATVFILLNISLAALLCATIFLVYRGGRWARRIVIALGIVEFLNGAAHFTMAVIVGGYFPGVVSAVFLFIFSILLLRASLRPVGADTPAD